MARIPVEVVERLKTEVSVQRLAEARGVALTKHGSDLHGRCPFHDDRTPSLVITPAKNLWHCLGACQAGGSVIDWVMKAEGVSFRHAVELLVNDSLPLAAASSAPPPKHSTVKKLPSALARDVEDAKLMIQVIEYYHETLLGSPEVLEYLKRRGIGFEEAIKTFKLGFANRTLGYRLPASTRVEGAALRGQLQRLGLYRGSGHGSLVIPIIGPAGEITEVYGRKLNDNLRAGTPLHLYLPGPHRGVWNAAALSSAKEIILCEALIDALTFWCGGYRNVTASYGVEVLTFGPRRYRVRGLEKNLSYESLKVNLLAAAPMAEADRPGEHPDEAAHPQAVHVDTLDLYQARARAAFVKSAAAELGVAEEIIKGDVGKVLLALEAEQEKLITAALEQKTAATVTIDEPARARAMSLLTSADLIQRIAADFSRSGVVGERSNALVGYLAAISRKLDRPLALLIQSTSAAGKSSLLDAVLRFVPEDDRIVYSAMTGQSLFYMGRAGSEAQDPGYRRGARRRSRELCVKALAKRGRADHHLNLERRRDRKTRDRRVPGRRSGDDRAHDHRRRDR
jgi:hypothetical protein